VNNMKEEYAVAYASEQVNETQENLHTTDKEAYAIYHALKTFYPYLYGTQFTVETDHNALEEFPEITENMSNKVIRSLVEFCRVNTGVKLVWIPGMRFDTGFTPPC
jgi:hypothetical protein